MKKARKTNLFVAACLVLVVGCARAPQVPEPIPAAPSIAPEVGDISSNQPTESPSSHASPQPTESSQSSPCGQLDPFPFLADYSEMTPEQRIQFSVGTAQQIWQEEASFIADGWPSAFLNGWRQEAWLKADVQESDPDTRLITLTHGSLDTTNKTRFEARCVGKSWSLASIGPEWRWYTPSPAKLPGQDSDLTEETAKALVIDVLSSYGSTRMRVSATNPELERGRQKAILTFSGSDLAPSSFPGVTERIRLVAEAQDLVSGEWLSDSGAATGEKVLFRREGGLWKVADHTVRGQWAPPPDVFKPRSFEFDLSLLGFELNLTRGELDRLFPLTGNPTPHQETIFSRMIVPTFGPNGKLTKIATSSGGTSRGLNVGDPVSAVYVLYGQPARKEPNCLVYTSNALPEEFRVCFSDHHGVERVDGFERRRTR